MRRGGSNPVRYPFKSHNHMPTTQLPPLAYAESSGSQPGYDTWIYARMFASAHNATHPKACEYSIIPMKASAGSNPFSVEDAHMNVCTHARMYTRVCPATCLRI